MNTQQFNLSDVLSITTKKLIGKNGLNGVYEVLSFLEGYSVQTIEIPSLMETHSVTIFEQHPHLRELVSEAISPSNYLDFVAKAEHQFGDTIILQSAGGSETK